MLIRRAQELTDNDVTDRDLYLDRRRFLSLAAAALGTAWVERTAWPAAECGESMSPDSFALADEVPNSLEQITGYNNYYEFSTNKEAVRILAQELVINPWTITVDGEVENPLTLDIDALLTGFNMEERIYRLRCVEGWSMVIPWQGFQLCELLKRARPTSQAKYVQFMSLERSSEMIGQRQASMDWPYREGLRIDEAVHPLTLVATGLYGESLPKQNGAPLRIVVPWKYGFKSPKAITHVRLMREQPSTSWNTLAPSEYGFYANVNPDVAHPRWSQRRENRIGELQKKPTRIFNGYAEQVAYLYQNLDLRTHF